MSSSEMCCAMVPMKIGGVFIAICSFILSTSLALASTILYLTSLDDERLGEHSRELFIEWFRLDLTTEAFRLMLCIIFVASVMWTLASLLLMIGLVKNLASFVVFYFGTGVIITILGFLAGLLVLLRMVWVLALVMFIVSGIHVHFLVVIYSVLELMEKGKYFSYQRQVDAVDDIYQNFNEVSAVSNTA